MFRKFFSVLSVSILLAISGCGEPADPSQAEQSDAPIMQVSDQFEVRKSEWKCDEQMSEAQLLQVDGFRVFHHDESVDWEEQKNVVGGSAMLVGDTVYSVCLEHDHDKTDLAFHLHKMTPDGSETFESTLHHEEGQVLMDAQMLPDGRAIVLLVTRETVAEQKLITDCEVLILNENGACEKQFNVTDAFIQAGRLKDGVLVGEFFCDIDGFLYVFEENETTNILHVIDEEGNLIADTTQYSGTFCYPTLDEKGEFYFLFKGKEGGNSIFWFDKENKEFRQMPAPMKGNIKQLLGFYHNYLYYLSGENITQWNLETGERIKILSLDQLGANKIDRVLESGSDYQLGVLQDGKLLLMNKGYADQYIAILAKELTPKEQLAVTSLIKDDILDLKAITARIGRDLEKYDVVYTKTDSSQEDYRNRMVADMIAGNGADILFVSKEDMWILQEKGLIADIKEFLPEDLMQKLRPNAMSIGENADGMWGIPMGVEVSTLLVQNHVWEGDSWTFEEMLATIEAWQGEELFANAWGDSNVALLMYAMVYNSLAGSDFVDLDKGVCNFESPEFAKILEICMKYADEKYYPDTATTVSMMKNGEYMGYISGGVYNEDYMDTYLRYGEVLHPVGYPSENGAGHYLLCDGMLVINKNCKSRDAVQQYLQGIVSKKIQNILSWDAITLRNDMERNNFEYEKEYEAYLKSEELISKCVPYDSRYDKIITIIEEECIPFFYGERTAKETAKIINNRVQLYLDERK